MDNAVALVQAFLRLHGYLTVPAFMCRPDDHMPMQLERDVASKLPGPLS